MGDKTPQIVRSMTLTAGGIPVDCWFLSPENPRNAELAPAGAYCLIPKTALKAGARYRVSAERDGGAAITWSFTTGR